MKNNKSIRIGIIGVGHLGNFHLKQLTTIQTASIVGIFDIDFERSEEISRKYNVPIFPNIESLLNEIDAVSIVTPTRHHYEIADKALNNDCHVFIEKPITDNLSHADKLLKKAKEKDKIIQVGHIERFNPAFMALDICQMKPRFIEAHRLAPFNIRGNDVPVVLDLMIHDLDIILSLIKSEIKDIRANGVKVVSPTVDMANSRIEFENGCVANLTASRISQKNMRKMRLFQEQNYITIDFQKGIIEEYRTHEKDTGSSEVQIALLTARISHLTEHLRTHRKDFHSRHGLIKMASKRRKLLDYLKRNNLEKYQEIVQKLKLRR